MTEADMKLADAAMLAASAFNRLVNLLERVEKVALAKLAEEEDARAAAARRQRASEPGRKASALK